MKKTLILLVTVACAMVPAAALADASNDDAATRAAKACKELRSTMGERTFKATYGTNANRSNAFGKCVSSQARSLQADQNSAAKECKAEQADANFAASHGGKTFAQFYGTGKNGNNALGKCVSQKANEAETQDLENEVNAAKQCKSERKTLGTDAFVKNYATNANGANAFGKCVSQTAKSRDDETGDDS